MNIAIDIRNLRDRYGGIPEYTRNIVRHLVRIGVEHHFILFYNGRKDPYFEVPEGSNITFVRTNLPNKIFNFFLYFFKKPEIDSLIEQKSGKHIDIFLAPDHNFFSFSKNPPKRALVIHDIGYYLFPYFLSIKGRVWIHRVSPKRLFKNMDVLISVSNTTKNDLVRYAQVPEKKISVVYQGIDNSFFKQDDSGDLVAKDKYIPLIGLGGVRKNAEVVLYALHEARKRGEMRDYRIIVVGSNRESKRLHRIARELGIMSVIEWRSHCSEDERISLYKNASIAVYPSFYEGFGLPPLEAMSLGIPVVAAANSAITEIVGDTALLVDPYNIQAWSNALICLSKNDIVRAKLIKKGRELSLNFTWDIRVKELLEVLEKIVE